jgi:DNA (cytosine-5)-methyltransferase 1
VKILDLFCGAGGAAMGYHHAFPDAEIVGVDINPQPRYPFTFVQADAMTYPLDGFDFIHASPPCQDHSVLRIKHAGHGTGWMLAATIDRLRAAGVPWVVENVPGSEPSMGGYFVTLCGSTFGLKVRRHRQFAASFLVMAEQCRHKAQGQAVGVYGHGGGVSRVKGWSATLPEAVDAMGIDWMNRAELSQAIPPAYTEHIGNALAAHLMERAA